MTRGMDELFDFLAEQGFNAMRTLVCHHGVLINGKLAAGSFDEGRNPTLVSKRYLEVLDIWVPHPPVTHHTFACHFSRRAPVEYLPDLRRSKRRQSETSS